MRGHLIHRRPRPRHRRTLEYAASRTADDVRLARAVRHHEPHGGGHAVPSSLTLIVMGSLVKQDELSFWPVVLSGAAGAVIGDQIGYAAGRFGGRPLLGAITRRIGGADKVDKAEALSREWAGLGVFLSRWLVGPLGPWVNLTSGLSEYSWPRFLAIDVAGELIWLLIYVSLGRMFSDQVQAIADVLGNLTWVIGGLLVASLLGCKLFNRGPQYSGIGSDAAVDATNIKN